jgi:hypothetical protein
MRIWRVGTFSMGFSLLFLGLILLFSQVLELELYQVLISWWPIILVVLGIEILVYLVLSKQEKPFLKYDFLSIFFVGILGMVGIGFAILSTTGIMEKASEVLERKEQTLDLPAFSYKLDGSITRIVVKTERQPITIEGTPSKEVSMIGTYRATLLKNEKLVERAEDILSVKQLGDTLFIELKELPRQSGPFDSYSSVSATLLIPSDRKLEVIARDNSIHVKPRTLLSDWNIENASEVSLQVRKDDDLSVSVTGVQEVLGQEEEWKISEQDGQNQNGYNDGYNRVKSATYQSGKGTYNIKIQNVYSIRLNAN